MKITNETVRELTETDVMNYTIHDVVLPTPGMDVRFPGNNTQQIYVDLLAELGLTLEHFKHKFV